MPMVSERVLNYARSQFRSSIEYLLDDPMDLCHPRRDLEPAEELAEQRKLAADLGLDFDALVAVCGTAYERERLADIESGKIVPPPREPEPVKDTKKTDFAERYRNDLRNGWMPEIVLASARKHQEGLRELPIDTPDYDKAIADLEALISELVDAGY